MGVHIKQAVAVSTVAWIKWRVAVLSVWVVDEPRILICSVHLADILCLFARRVNEEAVSRCEAGFTCHQIGLVGGGSF